LGEFGERSLSDPDNNREKLECRSDKPPHHLRRAQYRWNLGFFLKGLDSENVDKVVHRIDKEITTQIDSYGICPIVFNLFERLKGELNYRSIP